ncbi:hypothetical protein [Pedobacter immunditicola]|uniref:hypothetical protein n=1 Tax=Pedobacter immunditicola TaxID=3133440 RepID=UPI0030B222E3
MGNQNQNYGENQGEDRNRLNPNQQQRDQNLDDDASLITDGPVGENEGDGGADLYETDVIPGSEDVLDDLELDPDDDLNTNVEQEDLDALEGMDQDDDDRL